MDTVQLKSFIAIARTLNFTEAAKMNYITQSAISRQMKELEDTLGVKLFYRTKHSVSLTEEGEFFLRFAEDQMENEREIRAFLQNFTQGNCGMLRIASLPDMAFELCKCLKEFNHRYPTIQFTIDQLSGAPLGEKLLQKNHNFYYATTDTFSITHGFQYFPTHDGRFVLLANKEIAEKIDTSDVRTFSKLPFAFISRDVGPIYYDRIFSFCRSIGYSPLVMSHFNTGEACMLAVNAGIGISIATETTALMSKMEDVEILPFKHDHVALSGAIGWKTEGLNEASLKFLDVLEYLYPRKQFPLYET